MRCHLPFFFRNKKFLNWVLTCDESGFVNTIKEFSVTLVDIKRETLKDDFIQTKMYNKNPNVPDVFSLRRYIKGHCCRVVCRKKILQDFHMGPPMKKLTKNLMHWLRLLVDKHRRSRYVLCM